MFLDTTWSLQGEPSPEMRLFNRLEPRPRSADFQRALLAPVHDALWMLSRQWQMGEHQGEDAGRAVLTRLVARARQLSHASAPDGAVEDYDPTLPLETRVERLDPPMDLRMRLRLGQHWRTLLDHVAGLSMSPELIWRQLRVAFPLASPDPADPEQVADADLLLAGALAARRGVDGGAFLDALRAAKGRAGELIYNQGLNLPLADRARLDDAGAAFLAWCDRLHTRPTVEDRWVDERLEYQDAVAARRTGKAPAVLRAHEHHHGHLDWYSFDEETDAGHPLRVASGPAQEELVQRTLFPSRIRAPGVPAGRFWEIEDGRVNFGRLDEDRIDLAQVLLAEFALTWSNDWFLVPLTVPVGSLLEVERLEVTDVFGQRTLIGPAGARDGTSGWDRWAFFALSRRDDGAATTASGSELFLPPTVTRGQQGEPIESVRFLRDEGANMVWAVEAVVPDGLGGGADGRTTGARRRAAVETQAGSPATSPDAGFELSYRLRRDQQPEHWIPFVPVRPDPSKPEVRLRRGRVRRMVEGEHRGDITPRSLLLRPGDGPYAPFWVEESEVPRAGVVVETAWQRCRWSDGRVVLWLGRRKSTGRGEGSSGMRFDLLEREKQDA